MKLSFALFSSACENTETIKPSEAWHIAVMITNFVRKFMEVKSSERDMKGQNQAPWNFPVRACLCLNYQKNMKSHFMGFLQILL